MSRNRAGAVLGVHRVLVWLALVAIAWAAPACAERRIVITVDDLPWAEFAQTPRLQVEARHRRLLSALRGIPAVGFVNEGKLVEHGRLALWREQMLRDWVMAGLELGNHTDNHNDLHQVSVDDFLASIDRGERFLRPLLATGEQPLRWFRHPYLRTGLDPATRAAVDQHLSRRGYTVAPVTVDNGEWIHARAYLHALQAKAGGQARQLREDYLRYMIAKLHFFEGSAEEQFGRDIAQILLLHANALNADALPTLLAALRQQGYRFVSLEQALQDPAYTHDDRFYGRGGISWLHRWALTDQLPKRHYAGEPEVPAWVMAIAGVDSE